MAAKVSSSVRNTAAPWVQSSAFQHIVQATDRISAFKYALSSREARLAD